MYLEIVRCAPKGATVKRGSELSASCGRVSETENGQEQGELRTAVSKATLFQPGLNLGGLSEGEHLAALGGSEPFPFRHGLRRDTFPISWGQLLVGGSPSALPSGAEIYRRSCVGEKSQTFSLFRR